MTIVFFMRLMVKKTLSFELLPLLVSVVCRIPPPQTKMFPSWQFNIGLIVFSTVALIIEENRKKNSGPGM